MAPLSNVMPDKPWYYGFIIGLLLAAGLIAAVHYFMVVDLNTEIESAQRRLDELQTKIEAGRSAEKKLPQFRDEVARLEQELEKLRRILPSQRNTEEIIKRIKSLVDQGNLELRSLRFPDPQPSSESEVYADWRIDVQVEGAYHNLAIFYDRLSNFQRIINVDEFNIRALTNQEVRTIGATFAAKTFVYIEPSEEPAAAQPAAGRRASRGN